VFELPENQFRILLRGIFPEENNEKEKKENENENNDSLIVQEKASQELASTAIVLS
jgi:hypothetical protein